MSGTQIFSLSHARDMLIISFSHFIQTFVMSAISLNLLQEIRLMFNGKTKTRVTFCTKYLRNFIAKYFVYGVVANVECKSVFISLFQRALLPI